MTRAHIIAIGSEMLHLKRLDTNSLYLADQLQELGINLAGKSVTGDTQDAIASALERVLPDHDLIICTGGLGPTMDDKTREGIAQVLKRKIIMNEPALEHISAMYEKRDRPMTDSARRQAMVVDGAQALPNTTGMCPGQLLEKDGKVILLLPGVPAECEFIMEHHGIKALAQCFPKDQVSHTRNAHLFGVWESSLEDMIGPIYHPHSNPETTILASLKGIQLTLRGHGKTREEAEQQVAALWTPIWEKISGFVYSQEHPSLARVVVQNLKQQNQSLALMESCTGGHVASLVTGVPGASDVFRGGAVAYQEQVKEQLGVDSQVLQEHGVVSEASALAMAKAAQSFFQSDWALATTGEAGPDTSDSGQSVGTVCIGIAGPFTEHTRTLDLGNRSREFIQELSSHYALHDLWKIIT